MFVPTYPDEYTEIRILNKMRIIDIYVTQFGSPSAISQSKDKSEVMRLVQYEKQISRRLMGYAIVRALRPHDDCLTIESVLEEMKHTRNSREKASSREKTELSSKPQYPGVKFNTSNEAGAVVVCCALSSQQTGAQDPASYEEELGIDLVEEQEAGSSSSSASTDFDLLDQLYLSEMMLTKQEMDRIRAFPTRKSRQRIYAFVISIKEAFVKYHGIGLVGVSSFNDVEVEVPEAGEEAIQRLRLHEEHGLEADDDSGPISWIDFDQKIGVDFVSSWKAKPRLPFAAGPVTKAYARLFVLTFHPSLLGSVVAFRFPAPVRIQAVDVKELEIDKKKV